MVLLAVREVSLAKVRLEPWELFEVIQSKLSVAHAKVPDAMACSTSSELKASAMSTSNKSFLSTATGSFDLYTW